MRTVDERAILSRIGEMVAEEHVLRAKGRTMSPGDRTRLGYLEEHLDQAWDLLRQRRAKAEYNEDPESAHERSVLEVESYLQ